MVVNSSVQGFPVCGQVVDLPRGQTAAGLTERWSGVCAVADMAGGIIQHYG